MSKLKENMNNIKDLKMIQLLKLNMTFYSNNLKNRKFHFNKYHLILLLFSPSSMKLNYMNIFFLLIH